MIVIEPSEIKELRAKFPMEAHSIRQGHSNNAKTKCAWFVYLDRIAIIDRLDELFPGEWEYTMTEPLLRDKHYSAIGSLTIRGIKRQFNGTQEYGSFTPGNDEKGVGTDTFRRTASMWGIGSYLYNGPNIWTTLPAKGDWDAQRKYKAEAKNIFDRWFHGNNGQSPQQLKPPVNQDWAKVRADVAPLILGFAEGGLPHEEIYKLAGVSNWNDWKGWNKFTSAVSANEYMAEKFDLAVMEDSPEAAGMGIPFDDELASDPVYPDEEPNNAATFTYMRYFVGGGGAQKYLELATAKPGMNVPCTIVRAYGRSTEFQTMVGEEWYDANGLSDYDKKTKSMPWRKLKSEIELVYAQTEFYNTATGLVEDEVPF